MQHIAIAVFCLFSCIAQAATPRDFDTAAASLSSVAFTDASRSEASIKELYAIAKSHPENRQLLPLCLYWESFMYYSQGIANTAIKSRITEELKAYPAGSCPFENALLLHSSAMNDVITGNYTDALAGSLQALTLYRKLDNTLFAARVLQLLGVICHRTNNYEMAERFLKESLAGAVPRNEYFKSLINLYATQVRMKDKAAGALDAMAKLVPKIEAYNDLGLEAVIYANLGAGYFLHNQPEKVYSCYRKAIDVNKRIGNKSFTVSLLINFATYSLAGKNYQEAIRCIKEAEHLALDLNNAEPLSVVYFVLSDIYDKTGDTALAYRYLKKYNTQRDAILNSSSTTDAYQAYVSAFLKSAEKEISMTREEARKERRRSFVYLGFSLFIVLLAISLLAAIRQRRRHQALLEESEKKSLEKQLLFEKTIQQVNEEKHREILAAKEREVTSYSLMLSSKNNVLQEVLSHSRQLKKVLKEGGNETYNTIIKVINDNLGKDLEEHKFVHHFNEVHPDFFTKLKTIHPGLTENNLRICAYFKMGMSNKQMAAILNVSVETVKNGRYRLKKKLGLEEEDNLDDFLRGI